MLRRKLLLILGSLVALLVVMAVAAIWLLQGVLGDLYHIHTQALTTLESVNRLSSTIAVVETDLYRIQLGQERHLDSLIESVDSLQKLMRQIGDSYIIYEPRCQELYHRLQEQVPTFERHVGALATAQDAGMARQHSQAALSAAVTMNQDILALSGYVRGHVQQEQEALTARFRWLVLGLAIVFVIVINVSIIVLLRTAEMILRPIDQLVEASRELAHERFEHRVELGRSDEFDELARAYNHLASQLQANEHRKIEMLGQVALTLNHELNNAIAIIELQLRLLGRQANGNGAHEKCLRQIQETLERMTRTVESLKRVRRIVLTDYVAGVKMLDLQRSVEEEPFAQGQSPDHLPRTGT